MTNSNPGNLLILQILVQTIKNGTTIISKYSDTKSKLLVNINQVEFLKLNNPGERVCKVFGTTMDDEMCAKNFTYPGEL